MEKTTIQVKGMSCSHCEDSVKNALLTIDGVAAVDVHLQEGQVDVQFNQEVAMKTLYDAIEDQGYDVVPIA
ncbi:copper ion binding protein [Aureibacillus halotolerans]|uniref:Copper chaperone CopZ n=1 Tax=Aureibacillus halotolerans TaxID=1508390 RepID=A0A4R6TSX5_9BACI|nr:copper ion binding protein [Aureibacillus halotolerans]TDQ36750.1 copper chaperone [Aureibacillus halotolerans]